MGKNIIDSLVVLLELDNSNFKKNATESEKIQHKIQDNTTKQNKQQTETGKKTADLQTRQSKDAVKNNNAQSDSMAAIVRQAFALYGVFKTGQAVVQGTFSNIAKNSDLAYMAENVGMSASSLKAWQDAAAGAGGSAQAMAAQINKANQQVAQAKFGQLDQQGLAFFQWGGSNQKGEFKDAESLLKAKIKLLKDLMVKFKGDKTTVLYAATQMGLDENFFNFAMKEDPLGLVKQSEERNKLTSAKASEAQDVEKAKAELGTAVDRLVTSGQGITKEVVVGATHVIKGATKTLETVQEGGLKGLWEGVKTEWRTSKKGKIKTFVEYMQTEWVKAKGAQLDRENSLDPGTTYAVMMAESSGQVSPPDAGKGAIGPMQLMPKTASGRGIDPNDPAQNIEGGSAYLGELKRKYKDTRKALAAYNWGPGKLDKDINKTGSNWEQGLPKETKDFLATVTSKMAGQNSPSPVNIQNLNVTLPNVSNAAQFKAEIGGISKNTTLTTNAASGMQ